MLPFETYCLYLALKNHFTLESYDYFRYNGKVNATLDSFATRRDRFQFQRLSRKYGAEDMRDFLIANLLADKKWVGDFLEDDAEQNYLEFIRRKQSFTYLFTQEIADLFGDDPAAAFRSPKDELPPLIYKHLEGKVGLDTMAVLDTFVRYSPRFDERLGKDDVIWSKIRHKMHKLHPFLVYDKLAFKRILSKAI